jgi:hypothetical protein
MLLYLCIAVEGNLPMRRIRFRNVVTVLRSVPSRARRAGVSPEDRRVHENASRFLSEGLDFRPDKVEEVKVKIRRSDMVLRDPIDAVVNVLLDHINE